MSALIKMQYFLSKQTINNNKSTNNNQQSTHKSNNRIANVTIGKNTINLQFCLKNTIIKMYPYFLWVEH